MIYLEGGKASLYQWDLNQRVILTNIDFITEGIEVHFSSSRNEQENCLNTKSYLENGNMYANIPNILLQKSGLIYTYLYIRNEDKSWTEYAIEIIVLSRVKPADYIYTETETLSYHYLDKRLQHLEGEGLAIAVDEYLQKNPIEAGATKEEAEQIQKNKNDIEKLNTKVNNINIPTKVSELSNDRNYQTSDQVEQIVNGKIKDIPKVDLTGYATETYVKNYSQPKGNYADKEHAHSQYLTQHQSLVDYAKKSDVPTKTSQLTNDSKYVTSDVTDALSKDIDNQQEQINLKQPIGNYALKTEIPNVPVQSVNNKTGAVSLNAEDVGARPATWIPTYSDVGADKSGTASSAVSTHNTKTDAHNDIRLLITALANRLDALANSDDDTLDQMAEVVAYIKANRDLIEQVTNGKVSVADIVNNLTTNVSNRPLSASQGVALKALIDAIVIPTKVSAFTNDAGYLTQHQDISGKLDASALPTAINTALEQAKNSGEFKGDKPVKGTDYFTAADKTEMVNSVIASLKTETWTFTLEDGSTVNKVVVLK